MRAHDDMAEGIAITMAMSIMWAMGRMYGGGKQRSIGAEES